MNGEEREWGVVSELKVEADTHTSLLAAVTIAMTHNGKVSHWALDDDSLVLCWSGSKRSNLLPTPLKDPEMVTLLIENWLKDSAIYPIEPDTDGSVKKGYRVEIVRSYTDHIVCKVTPIWVIYSK